MPTFQPFFGVYFALKWMNNLLFQGLGCESEMKLDELFLNINNKRLQSLLLRSALGLPDPQCT